MSARPTALNRSFRAKCKLALCEINSSVTSLKAKRTARTRTANWLQSYSEPNSFEWHNCTITKILIPLCECEYARFARDGAMQMGELSRTPVIFQKIPPIEQAALMKRRSSWPSVHVHTEQILRFVEFAPCHLCLAVIRAPVRRYPIFAILGF
jgi:hypothetical protein